MTQFKIVMKKKNVFSKKEIVVVHGDGYFVGESDSMGYARFVVFRKSERDKSHQFVCNAHDIKYILFKPLRD